MNEKAEARILSQSTFSRKSSAARDIPGHVHGGWHRHGQVLVPVGGVGEGLVLRLLGPVVLGGGGQALEHGRGGESIM